ncbi:hypothetical protein FQR65_LT00961 [Abscondita terminalis]|nr:hypothetical protein FQR65_LT00961 [Abscondita terminalis]
MEFLIEELPEVTEITEVVSDDGKPKKRTKKTRKIVKEKDGLVQETEIVTIQDDKEEPQTTVTIQEISLTELADEAVPVEEIPEVLEVTEVIADDGKPKKRVKKVRKIVKEDENKVQTTEIVTVEDEGSAPQTTVAVEETDIKTIKKKKRVPKSKEVIVEELPELIEVTEIISEEGTPKKRTKKTRKIVKEEEGVLHTTEIVTIQEDKKEPEVSVVNKEIPLPQTVEEAKPVEEISQTVEVTEVMSKEGKPKKRVKKVRKIIKEEDGKVQTTAIVTVEDEGEAPQTIVTVQETEITEETIRKRKPKKAKDEIIQELPEIIEVTDIISDEGKPKKRTKKIRKIVKEKDGVIEATEIVTTQDDKEEPITTVTIEEVALPKTLEEAIPVTEIPEVVEITEVAVEDEKPKKRIKKVRKIIKKDDDKLHTTEIVTVEDEGQAPVTTVLIQETETEMTEERKHVREPKESRIEELPEIVEVTEIISEDGKPKKRTKKTRKIVKEEEGILRTTEIVTTQDEKEQPSVTVVEQEIVLPVTDSAVSVEEVPELIEITEVVAQDGKPKKRVKKVRKIIKRDDDKIQTTAIVTVEDEGEAPKTTVVVEESEVSEQTEKTEPIDYIVEELPEVTEITEVIAEDGKPKKRTKKTRKIVKEKDGVIQATEIIIVQDDKEEPQTTVTIQEVPLLKTVEDTIKIEEIPEVTETTEIIGDDGAPKKRVKKVRKLIKKDTDKVQTTEIVTVEDEGQVPVTTVTVEEIATTEIPKKKKKIRSKPELKQELYVPSLEDIKDEKDVLDAVKLVILQKIAGLPDVPAVQEHVPTIEDLKTMHLEEIKDVVSTVPVVTIETIETIKDDTAPTPRKKVIRKIIKDKGAKQHITTITTDEKDNVIAVNESVEDMTLDVKQMIKNANEVEIPEVTDCVEVIDEDQKPVKRTIKRRTVVKDVDGALNITEIITSQDDRKIPETTIKETVTGKKKKKVPKIKKKTQSDDTEHIKPIEDEEEIEETLATKAKQTDTDEDYKVEQISVSILPAVEEDGVTEETPEEIVTKKVKKIKRVKKGDKPVKEETEEEEVPQKVNEETTKTMKDKPKSPKAIPIKLEYQHVKPQKLNISDVADKPINLADIKLRKPKVPEKKKPAHVKLPKFMLKSRINVVSFPPTLEIEKQPVISELQPAIKDNGELSRNMADAEIVLKTKKRKLKIPKDKVTDLEKLDQELEELKKQEKEVVDDQYKYERKSKDVAVGKEEASTNIKLGKGKVPKIEEDREEVRLKKIPGKPEIPSEETVKKPVKKVSKDKKDVTEIIEDVPEISPFETYDIERPEIGKEALEKIDIDEDEEEKPKDKVTPKRKPKPKKPVQEIESVDLIKNIPKLKEDEQDEEKQFRIPKRDGERESPEKVKLKPFVKETDEKDNQEEPKVLLELPKPIPTTEEKDVPEDLETAEKEKPKKIKKVKKQSTKAKPSEETKPSLDGVEILESEEITEEIEDAALETAEEPSEEVLETDDAKDFQPTEDEDLKKKGKSKIVRKVKKIKLEKPEETEKPAALEKESRKVKPKPILMKMETIEVKPQKLVIDVPKDQPIKWDEIKLKKPTIPKKKEIKTTKIPKILLKSRITFIEYPPILHIPVVKDLVPAVKDNGELSRNVEEAEIIIKTKKRKIKLKHLEKLDDEMKDLKQNLEKVDDTFKFEKKPKKEKQPVKMKIDRWEIKPMKLEVSNIAELPVKIEEIKLKKPKTTKKGEIPSVTLPKFLLKSRIVLIEFPPLNEILKTPLISYITVSKSNGVISRNVEEAIKLKKRKIPKIKDHDEDISELEHLELGFEDEKEEKDIPEDQKEKYERKPKKVVDKEEEEPKKLKIGKGKIPVVDEGLETVKLKGIPKKEPDSVEEESTIRKKDKPEDVEIPKDSTTEKLMLSPFEPHDIDRDKLELSQLDLPRLEPAKDEEKEKDVRKKKTPKSKKPAPETIEIQLEKGAPKPKEEDIDTDVKFRIPEKKIPDDDKERLSLKPFVKETSEEDKKSAPEVELELPQPLPATDTKEEPDVDDTSKEAKPKKVKKIIVKKKKSDAIDNVEGADDITHLEDKVEVATEELDKPKEIPEDVTDITSPTKTEEEIPETGKSKTKKIVKRKKVAGEKVEGDVEELAAEEQPKVKDKKQRPKLMKLEITEVKPQKLNIIEAKDVPNEIATIKLKKRPVEKKDVKTKRFPKVLLKSRITYLTVPLPLLPIISELKTVKDCGILSRNVEEGIKVIKIKKRKFKPTDKYEEELEKLDTEFDEIKNRELEKVDDEFKYQRKPKQQPDKVDDQKGLKIGKGKIPKDENEEETVTLKKIPQKDKPIDEKDVVKKVEDKTDEKPKKTESKKDTDLTPFEPFDIDQEEAPKEKIKKIKIIKKKPDQKTVFDEEMTVEVVGDQFDHKPLDVETIQEAGYDQKVDTTLDDEEEQTKTDEIPQVEEEIITKKIKKIVRRKKDKDNIETVEDQANIQDTETLPDKEILKEIGEIEGIGIEQKPKKIIKKPKPKLPEEQLLISEEQEDKEPKDIEDENMPKEIVTEEIIEVRTIKKKKKPKDKPKDEVDAILAEETQDMPKDEDKPEVVEQDVTTKESESEEITTIKKIKRKKKDKDQDEIINVVAEETVTEEKKDEGPEESETIIKIKKIQRKKKDKDKPDEVEDEITIEEIVEEETRDEPKQDIPKEAPVELATVKLKKPKPPQKKPTEIKLPRFLLKSRIRFIEYPPKLHLPIIRELTTVKDNGELSRNISEAAKIIKKKIPKVKDVDKELSHLEQLDLEVDALKKDKETIDDQYKYQKPPKEKVPEEDNKKINLEIGKGKVPETKEVPETVKLKKIHKKPKTVEDESKKPIDEVETVEKSLPKTPKDEEGIEKFKPSDIKKDDITMEASEDANEKPLDDNVSLLKDRQSDIDSKIDSSVLTDDTVEEVQQIEDADKPKKVKKISKKKKDTDVKPTDEVEQMSTSPADNTDNKETKPDIIESVEDKRENTDTTEKPKKIKKLVKKGIVEDVEDAQIKNEDVLTEEKPIDDSETMQTSEKPKKIKKVPKKKDDVKKIDDEEKPIDEIQEQESDEIEQLEKVQEIEMPEILDKEPQQEKLGKKKIVKKKKDKLLTDEVSDETSIEKPKEEEKPKLMIIQRKTIQPQKVEVVESNDLPAVLQAKSLKPRQVPQKKTVQKVKLPKFMLKSTIRFIDFPPLSEIYKMPLITQLNTIKDNGVLSRNIEDAIKKIKIKKPKLKDIDRELKELEKLDTEFDELKKDKPEKVDDQFKYEKKPKQKPKEEEEEVKPLRIGKGKLPEETEELDDVKLKKIPVKQPEIEDTSEKKSKPKPEDEMEKPQKLENEEPKLPPFEPFDIERDDLDLEKPILDDLDKTKPKKKVQKKVKPKEKVDISDAEPVPEDEVPTIEDHQVAETTQANAVSGKDDTNETLIQTIPEPNITSEKEDVLPKTDKSDQIQTTETEQPPTQPLSKPKKHTKKVPKTKSDNNIDTLVDYKDTLVLPETEDVKEVEGVEEIQPATDKEKSKKVKKVPKERKDEADQLKFDEQPQISEVQDDVIVKVDEAEEYSKPKKVIKIKKEKVEPKIDEGLEEVPNISDVVESEVDVELYDKPEEDTKAPEEIDMKEKHKGKKIIVVKKKKDKTPQAELESDKETDKPRPVLMKIERKTIQPDKVEVVESKDLPALLKAKSLKPREIPQKKTPQKVKLPKVMLKSSIRIIQFPPLSEIYKLPLSTELKSLKDNGVLSRNIEDAVKRIKTKKPKIKDIDQEIKELEKLDTEFEDLKKDKPEKLDEQYKYEKKPKDKPKDQEEEIKPIRVGKGKVPKEKEGLEDINLKKIPVKQRETEDTTEKIPKSKPEDLKDKPDQADKEQPKLTPFEPFDIDRDDNELEKTTTVEVDKTKPKKKVQKKVKPKDEITSDEGIVPEDTVPSIEDQQLQEVIDDKAILENDRFAESPVESKPERTIICEERETSPSVPEYEPIEIMETSTKPIFKPKKHTKKVPKVKEGDKIQTLDDVQDKSDLPEVNQIEVEQITQVKPVSDDKKLSTETPKKIRKEAKKEQDNVEEIDQEVQPVPSDIEDVQEVKEVDHVPEKKKPTKTKKVIKIKKDKANDEQIIKPQKDEDIDKVTDLESLEEGPKKDDITDENEEEKQKEKKIIVIKKKKDKAPQDEASESEQAKDIPDDKPKLKLMKIERKTMRPDKIEVIESKDLPAVLKARSLKPREIPQKKDVPKVKLPKFLLKSPIRHISFPPLSEVYKIPVITDLKTLKDNGVLSRNIDDAVKKIKIKKPKLKEIDHEIEQLEKLDTEFEELKKDKPEKVEDEYKYEKRPKQKPNKEEEKVKSLKIGKGEVPKEDDTREEVKLKKMPSKQPEIEDTLETIPQVTPKETKEKPIEINKEEPVLSIIEPFEIEREDVKLDKPNLETIDITKPKPKSTKKVKLKEKPEILGEDMSSEDVVSNIEDQQIQETIDEISVANKEIPNEVEDEKLPVPIDEVSSADVQKAPDLKQVDTVDDKQQIEEKPKKVVKKVKKVKDDVDTVSEANVEEIPKPAEKVDEILSRPLDKEEDKSNTIEDQEKLETSEIKDKEDVKSKEPKKKVVRKTKPDDVDLSHLEKLDKEFEDLKKTDLEKVDDGYKERATKKPRKIEEKNVEEKPPAVVQPSTEEVKELPTTDETNKVEDKIDVIKDAAEAKEIEEAKPKEPKEKMFVKTIPKHEEPEQTLSKSNITYINFPPTSELPNTPKMLLLELLPLNAIVSENIKEAAKIKKAKVRKPKHADDIDLSHLEKLDKEFEDLKKAELETVDDEYKDRTAKKPRKPEEKDVDKAESKTVTDDQPIVKDIKETPKIITHTLEEISRIQIKPTLQNVTDVSPTIQQAKLKESLKPKQLPKKVSFSKLPKYSLKSRMTVIEFPPKSEVEKTPTIKVLQPVVKDNGVLSRTLAEAEKVVKKKPKVKPDIDKLGKLDKEMEELKKNELEKVHDEFKQVKPKSKKEKPIKMKIERWEIKPEKVNVVAVEEVPVILNEIKLKKKASQEKPEIQSTTVPKVLLSSRIQYIEFPPLSEILKKPIIEELHPIRENGVLSRNIKEAEKIKKKKIPKIKDDNDEFKKLEQLDKEMEELKKQKPEKVDDQYKYERKPKEAPEVKDDEVRPIKIGKGEVPVKKEEELEQVPLKKTPEKMPEIVVEEQKPCKEKDEKEKDKDTEVVAKEKPKLPPFEPYDIEREDSEKPTLSEEDDDEGKGKDKTTVTIQRKPKEKTKEPIQEIVEISITPGKPKEKEEVEDVEKKYKVPQSDENKEKRLTEKPKEVVTAEEANNEQDQVKDSPEVPGKRDEEETEVIKTIKKKGHQKIKKKPSVEKVEDESKPKDEIKAGEEEKPIIEKTTQDEALLPTEPESTPITDQPTTEITITPIQTPDKEQDQPEDHLPKSEKVEEPIQEITIKAKPKPKPEEIIEEVVLRKDAPIPEEELVEPLAEVTIKPKKKRKPDKGADEISIKKIEVKPEEVVESVSEYAEPTPEKIEKIEEPVPEIISEIKPDKKMTPEEDAKPEEISIKKPDIIPQTEETIQPTVEVKIRPKAKPKPEEITDEVTVARTEVEKPKEVEEPVAEVTVKPQPKPKSDEGADEVSVKKVVEIQPEETEEPAAEITIKPKSKPKPDEGDDDVTIKKIKIVSPEQAEEPATEITLKPKSKPKPDEGVDEVTVKKIQIVQPKEEEEPAAEITIKPKLKPKPDEGADEVTIKKIDIIKPEEIEEPVAEVTIKSKPKIKPEPTPDEDADEVTIKKLEVTQPQTDEELVAEATVKPKPSPKPDEGADEVTIKKVEIITPDDKDDTTTKPKRKVKVPKEKVVKKKEDVIPKDDIDDRSKQPIPEKVSEEPSADISIKPVAKPTSDEGSDEVTIKKVKVEEPVETTKIEEDAAVGPKPTPDEPSAVITIRPKPAPTEDEGADEITIKKLKVVEPPQEKEAEEEETEVVLKQPESQEVDQELSVKKKAPRKGSKDEHSEDITVKRLKPTRKSSKPENEEIQTVTFRPKVTKSKEDVEQEFRIQLDSYAEEEISMSGKIRLKRRPTYGEEMAEDTVKVVREIEDDGPTIEEIIDEGSDAEELPYDGEEQEEESFHIALRKKPKRKPYKVQEETEEEVKLGITIPVKPTEEDYEEESLSVSLKPQRKVSIQTFDEEAAALRIIREQDIIEEDHPTEDIIEGELFFSISTYLAETDQAIDLVEGERVFVLETDNPNWWLVKKNLTQEKGWVPANYLMTEENYAIYLQKKLNEKIDKLPVFEKPSPGEESNAPRFTEKLRPQHAHDGETIQFECRVVGSPRPQITWFRQTAVIKPSQDFEMFYDDDNVATLIIKEVFPEDAGTFTCVAKNSAGFASSTTELVVELPLSEHGSDATGLSRKSLSRESSLGDILEGIIPTFFKKPTAQCVDEGTDVTLECRLVAIPEPNITWYFNGKPLIAKDNVTIATTSDMHTYSTTVKIKKVKKSQEGTYEVRAKNREGDASVTVLLKVITEEQEAPEILEKLKNITVKKEETVIFTTRIVGTPKPTVTWFKDGEQISKPKVKENENIYSLTITKSKVEDTAKYTVKATNSLGVAESTAQLTVEEFSVDKPEPPMFTERFQGLTVTEKSTIRLFARVIGNPVPTITWLRNNEPLKPDSKTKISYDGENIELVITNANSETDSGDYKCIASNTVGKASHGAKVFVDVETVKFTKKLKKTVEILERDTLTLECETSHIVSTKWFHNSKEITGMEHHVLIEEGRTHKLVIKKTALNDAGTFKCTVKNQKTESNVTVIERKPEFTRRLNDCEVKEKDTAIFEVEITSDTADVVWQKDGRPIDETDERFTIEKQEGLRRLIIRNISIHDEGEYSCALPNDQCTADLSVIELPPEIITKMEDQSVTKGEKATFEIELTKGDALVRWFKDGTEIQFSEHIQLSIDGKRQKLKIYNSDLDDKGTYSCQVGDQKSSAKLTVKKPPLRFVKELPEYTITRLNVDITLTVELNRSDVEVEWLRRGRIIEESTKYTILTDNCVKKMIIHNVKREDEVEYSCRVEDLNTTTILKVEIVETAPKLFLDDEHKVYKVRNGENVTFTIKYTATPTPTTEWTVNQTFVLPSRRHQPTIDEENVSLTIRRVEPDDMGKYTIKLRNNCGEASASLTLIVMDIPTKPGTPELVDVTDNSITLHWKAPESDGNTPITNYIIEYREKDSTKWTRTTETIINTNYTITSVQKHKEYSFRVIAVNEIGESQPSNNSDYILIATPTAKEAPTIIKTLKDIKIGLKKELVLSCVITGHPLPDITWFKDGKVVKSKTITYENHIAKYTIEETTETTEGIYTVKAQNMMGTAETRCQVMVQEIPLLEVDQTLVDQMLKVNEQWKVAFKVSGYPHPDITWKKDGMILTTNKHAYYFSDETSTTIVIYSLDRTDTGTYTVVAENSAGFAEKELKLRVVDKPTPPQGPMVIGNIEKTSALISWHPPLDDGGLELTKYLIEKYEISTMKWAKVADVETTVTSYTVQELQTNAEYLFRVYAQNPIGKSEPLESEKLSLKSSFKVPSPPRAPLEVSGMSATSFTINWQASSSDGGSSIIEYIVEMKEANRRVFKKLGGTKGAVTSFSVNYLEKDQGYNFKITARNSVGLSEPFLPEDTITAGSRITTPSAPRNLRVTDTATKSATIAWEPPENTGGSEITGYVIEKKFEYMPTWEKVATVEEFVREYTFENLKEKTKYVFRVFAENCVGLSSPATTSTVHLLTHATVPSPPTAPLEIRTIGPNAIVIEWGIPEYDGGAPLLGYNIAIKDTKKTMWMEVGRVTVPTQKFTIRDLQEGHEYLIRVFARNEVGISEPLESDEPFKVLPSTDADAEEFKEVTDREPTSYSTETTTSWLRDNSMDADIYTYSKGKLLQKNEYFFKVWCFADELFK